MTDVIQEAHLHDLVPVGWEIDASAMCMSKTFKFADFAAAFGWMTQMALIAEKANHHPEWRNVYRTVEVTLTTHDSGGITQQDISLALKMNEAAADA